MAAENKQQIMDYLKTAIDLESDVLEQNQIIQEFTSLSLSKKPVEPQACLPDYPKKPSFLDHFGLLFFGFIGSIGGIPLFVIFLSQLFNDSWFDWGLFIPSCVFLSPLIIHVIIYIKSIKAYQDICAQIPARRDAAQKNFEQQKASITKNTIAWNNSHKTCLQDFQGRLTKTTRTLNALYAENVIFDKYRSLPALTSIYEYLQSGRCDTLTGPYGAYNLYEDELRKNVVISQLNTVINQLEQIRNSQYILYQKVSAVLSEAQSINRELKQISGYTYTLVGLTALNTYYTASAARNSAAVARYHLTV